MKAKQYITSITEKDMEEIAAMTNLEAGFLIRIDRTPGKVTIGIDPGALALAINGFVRNGGTSQTSGDCLKTSFNPPS